MGLINQVGRALKQLLRNLFRSRKKKRSTGEEEPIEVPESWGKQQQPQAEATRKVLVITKHKTRIPGLRTINRILAGIMLLLNLAFSQFLLGSVGTEAQPMFILFLLNSYLILRLLWITRKKEG